MSKRRDVYFPTPEEIDNSDLSVVQKERLWHLLESIQENEPLDRVIVKAIAYKGTRTAHMNAGILNNQYWDNVIERIASSEKFGKYKSALSGCY